MKKAIFFLFFNTILTFSYGQEQKNIRFENPSFELYNAKGNEIIWRTFEGLNRLEIKNNQAKIVKQIWVPCSFGENTPPDVQPGWFEVKTKAQHGKTYVGMVTRNDTTWEGFSQKLEYPLQKDSCYTFNVYLMNAPKLISFNKILRKETNFNAACILKVWGGDSFCSTAEILFITPPVREQKWTNYQLQIQPKKTITHIFFVANYSSDAIENGNLMMDNLSEIKLIPCNFK